MVSKGNKMELFVRKIFGSIDEVCIDANNIEQSMKWAFERGYTYISLNQTHGWVNGTSLAFLRDYPWVEGLWLVTENADITPVNYLKNLKYFGSSKKEIMGNMDFRNFPKLEFLVLNWNEKLFRNFDDCTCIKTLHLYDYPYINLSRLIRASKLLYLEIYYAKKLVNLDGLENLKELTRLKINYAGKLNDISRLASISSSLKALSLEFTKSIRDYSVLEKLDNLEAFYISNNSPLHSIQWMRKLKNIKHAYVGVEVLDGDVKYLIEKKFEYRKLKKYVS